MSDLVSFAGASRQSRASLLGTWLDGGTIDLYDAPRAADPDTAIETQILLCAIALDDPAGAAEDGVWTADPLPGQALILASGTPAWARVRDANGDVVADIDVGASGSGAALELDNLSLVAGAYLTPTSLTIVEG
jgi:hypothetical protein